MTQGTQGIAQADIARDLRALGLAAGDMVYVHTSMKRIGWLAQGAQTLIDAFAEVLTPEGTLAVPSHTLSFAGRPPYDPRETATGLGTFPDAVWRAPGASRSGHASHASAAIGARAAWLTENHDPTHALGFDSPLHRLYREGGRILLLGVTFRACTALHLAESLSGVPYTALHYDARWGSQVFARRPDGTVAAHTQVEYPGCSSGFDRILPHVPEGALRTGRVGAAESMLVAAAPLLDTAIRLLREDPGFFLCTSQACPCCPPRRALLAAGERT